MSLTSATCISPSSPCLGLNEVPTGIPEDVVHIDLSYNSIRQLRAKDFHGARSLRTLNFSNNNMEHMDTGMCAIILTAVLFISSVNIIVMCSVCPLMSGQETFTNTLEDRKHVGSLKDADSLYNQRWLLFAIIPSQRLLALSHLCVCLCIGNIHCWESWQVYSHKVVFILTQVKQQPTHCRPSDCTAVFTFAQYQTIAGLSK